ncbi:FKBP-type peptidyl-prolyl cis-trans isomerase [Urbifossiella limnaea]|uniref:Peptidyl-prolyl cis-trans isomerase n=1 Tax=Urbifossiella limnaea TaxID=2528023 RepID=A0A517XMX7_9BACT|nr:FKBP-type peptidyl-prolyl cis-trans isomerase [Urbifossiella limnaea]QDU18857.1 FK506-binding protein [Urbifossiella limnaea]
MDPRLFRPAVDGLESRLVPASLEADVVAAYTRTVTNTEDLFHLGTTLHRGRTANTISILATQLPQTGLQSRTDAGTLTTYRTSLQQSLALNPAASTPAVQEFLMQVAGAEAQAILNGVYADLYARGFGGTPIPPPVPPSPPPGGGTVFGPDLSPPTSTLPFSLTDPNFRTLPDGVRVWDVTTGSGATLTANGSNFTASYTGYLTNGTVFDSGTLTGRNLSTSNYIAGFVSGLAGMQVGGTRRIVIPAALGYGSTARPGIPANSDLVFEVTLTSIP